MNRKRLMPMESIEQLESEGNLNIADSTVISPESAIVQKETDDTIKQLVANLPERYRMLIHLYYSANLSVEEIAEMLHIPKGTVKSRMSKARSLLKKELEVLGYDR